MLLSAAEPREIHLGLPQRSVLHCTVQVYKIGANVVTVAVLRAHELMGSLWDTRIPVKAVSLSQLYG